MRLLFDFFPIVLFFIAFKLYGIYVATAVAMAASALQVSYYWLRHRRFETMHLITLALVILLGGATLLLHNAIYIKWKPTAIYWAFSLAFLGSRYIGSKTFAQRLMQGKINLPVPVWNRINLSWVLFFALLGALNIYVVYHFSTNAWVNFKLFGTLGLTLLFVIGQALYMARHAKTEKSLNDKKSESA